MKCRGCGAQIQHENQRKPGYVPLEVFQKRRAEGKDILCQRCFRMRHYGKLESVKITNDFVKKLSKLVRKFEVVVWVLDISDFEGSYDPLLAEILKDLNKIIVVNKIDLLPKAVTIREIKSWVEERLKGQRFRDVYLTSAAKNYGTRSLLRALSLYENVIFIGMTNVGKSSIFQKLTGVDVNVTPFPGTTLDLIKATVKNTDIFDTPGIFSNRRIIDFLEPGSQKKISQKSLSRMTFKPQKGQTIFIGGLCRLDFSFDTELPPIFQIFASESVKFHVTGTSKADNLHVKQYGRLLVPPFKPKELSMDSLNWKEEEFELNTGEELAIAGLGWLSVRRGPFKAKVKTINDVIVKKRKALVNPYRGGMRGG
ncbi:ribosome biogenesis GTPase YqeH [Pseudothermotoga elfii]|jgi:hypothetical protein|uniref:ribosome biogenesis GTPase YqeH n=1 Tax=Pseudothermotoga elfii TaxID=38322 RepID=UPI0003F5EB3D|nr:ribosome biogenesis GTPase YqeH [Pseudothermotoga elfii]